MLYDSCTCRNDNVQECNRCETGLSVLVGIISGIIFTAVVVLLFTNGLITDPGFAGWAALITVLVYLFVVIAVAAGSEKGRNCLECYLGSIIFGIFGTIFSGYLSVSTVLEAGTVFPAVVVGLTAFFFAYMIAGTFFLIRCIVRE